MTLDSIQAQLKKIDEYGYVGKVIRLLHSQNPESTKTLVASLKPEHQEYLKDILQSKRVAITRRGVRTTVARKVVKAKQRTIPGPPGPALQ
jgi:hypothetical protein